MTGLRGPLHYGNISLRCRRTACLGVLLVCVYYTIFISESVRHTAENATTLKDLCDVLSNLVAWITCTANDCYIQRQHPYHFRVSHVRHLG